MYMLGLVQQNDWNETLTVARLQLLRGCNSDTSAKAYRRLEDSLRRWISVTLEFKGNFYDGKNYQTLSFGIIDAWEIEEGSKKLMVRFSTEWLNYIKNSTYYKVLDFDSLIKMRSPLALRLHELLVKSFQGRSVWQIDALKLAAKIPMSELHAAHIIPKIQAAVGRINKHTSLQVELEVQRPVHGKALFIFRKQASSFTESIPVVAPINEKLETLLALLPENERVKQSVISGVEAHLKIQGVDFVSRNILYANANSSKNYPAYLSKALQGDWGAEAKIEISVQETPEGAPQSKKVETPQQKKAEVPTIDPDMLKLVEDELQTVRDIFLESRSENELFTIGNRVSEQIDLQMPNLSESEKIYHKKSRLLSTLQERYIWV